MRIVPDLLQQNPQFQTLYLGGFPLCTQTYYPWLLIFIALDNGKTSRYFAEPYYITTNLFTKTAPQTIFRNKGITFIYIIFILDKTSPLVVPSAVVDTAHVGLCFHCRLPSPPGTCNKKNTALRSSKIFLQLHDMHIYETFLILSRYSPQWIFPSN